MDGQQLLKLPGLLGRIAFQTPKVYKILEIIVGVKQI